MATGGPSGGNTDSLIKFALLQPAPEGMIYNPLTGVNEYSYAVTTTGGQVRMCSLSRCSLSRWSFTVGAALEGLLLSFLRH